MNDVRSVPPVRLKKYAVLPHAVGIFMGGQFGQSGQADFYQYMTKGEFYVVESFGSRGGMYHCLGKRQ